MNIPSLKNAELKDKRVLVRLDFDYLFEKNFKPGKKELFYMVSPTIEYLLNQGARVVIAPSFENKAKKKNEYSVEQYARYVCDLYKCNVYLTEQAVGDVAVKLSQDMESGSILFLENLFDHEGELSGEKEFADKISKVFDTYVYEAFTLSDRQLASNHTVLDIIDKENILLGFNFESEYLNINKILSDTNPLTLLLSNGDIPLSITIAENLIERVERILLAGEISDLYFNIKSGSDIKKYKRNVVNRMKKLTESVKARDIEIANMVDYYVTEDTDKASLIKNQAFKEGQNFMDIGEETGKTFSESLPENGHLLWVGNNFKSKESELVFGSAKIFDKINNNNIYSIGLDTGRDRFNSKNLNEGGFLNFYSNCYNIFIKFISNEQLPLIDKLESKVE